MLLNQLKASLLSSRITGASEQAFQDTIERRLEALGVPFQREKRLPGKFGRIDFALDLDGERVGIECKAVVTGQATARQLLKYALSGEFDRLVLLTSRAYALPAEHFTREGQLIPVHVWQSPTL